MQFVQRYNHEHRHSGIRYVTPAQRHAGRDRHLLEARHAVYQSARQRNPRRWSGNTRNWTPVSIVTLNPERDAYVQATGSQMKLSGSIGEPAFPSRPGNAQATEHSGGDGRRGATRSHAQRTSLREHGEDGEHRTFSAVSTEDITTLEMRSARHPNQQLSGYDNRHVVTNRRQLLETHRGDGGIVITFAAAAFGTGLLEFAEGHLVWAIAITMGSSA